MPCALVPWVEGNETGNLVAIAPELKVDAVYDGPHVDYASLPPPLNAEFSCADQRELTERLIESRASDGWRWANPNNTEDGAEERAAIAAQYFGPADRILDLGSGLLRAAMHLRSGNVYTPVDLVRFSKFTILIFVIVVLARPLPTDIFPCPSIEIFP